MSGEDDAEVTKQIDAAVSDEIAAEQTESDDSVHDDQSVDAGADAQDSPAEVSGQSDAVDEATAAVDEAAESFVELEQMLGHLEIDKVRGRAIDVDQVAAEEVPEEFPYDITTEDALALRLVLVDAGEQTVTTYFEWPDPQPDERLAKLLDLLDIPADRFADLHGADILLRTENRQYVPVLPEKAPKGDERGIYGILAGIAPSLVIALAGIFGVGGVISSTTFVLLWLVATFAVVPASVYLDAWHLRTTTDWDGGPLFWATLSMIPGLNVLVVPAYLILRESSEPIV